MTLTLRPAVVTDAVAVAGLMASTGLKNPLHPADIALNLAEPDRAAWVLTDGRAYVGYLSTQTQADHLMADLLVVAQGTSPDDLVKAAEQEARRRRQRRVRLQVPADDRPLRLALSRYGFAPANAAAPPPGLIAYDRHLTPC
jgi:hypothetical protein